MKEKELAELSAAEKRSDKDAIDPKFEKKNHKHYNYDSAVLESVVSWGNAHMDFLIEVHKTRSTGYRFKVISQKHKERVHSFESDGNAHHVSYEDAPDKTLKERRVDTPHFHKVNSDGRLVAYRTQEIETQSAPIEDIAYWFEQFCQESKIVHAGGSKLRIKIQAKLVSTQEDPLAGVKF